MEFEAGELAADFVEYSEAQIEATLQNLCKNGPPPTGGLRVISAFSAGRQVYKRAPASATAPAPAVATPPPSKQQIYDRIKVLCEKHNGGDTHTFKQVRLCPSRASDAPCRCTMPPPPTPPSPPPSPHRPTHPHPNPTPQHLHLRLHLHLGVR